MGLYTNFSLNEGVSSDYTSVEPFKGDHFNYQSLGIIAAAESAANQNAFMKAIALQELAAMEQYGTTDVLYEGVNIRGIIDKVKAFFKKIIEKIHKIFHTFVAKMASWFGNSADFAKKYEKEIMKNWSQVSNDWEFKGYEFKNIYTTKAASADDSIGLEATKTAMKNMVNAYAPAGANEAVKEAVCKAITDGNILDAATYTTKVNGDDKLKAGNKTEIEAVVKALRDKLDDIKDLIRGQQLDGSTDKKLDASEYNEELFKYFRNNEDSKQDLKKSDVLSSYGGSINGMMTFLKDFSKIKENLEKEERAFVKGIDDVIKNLEKANDNTIKSNKDPGTTDATKETNEATVGLVALVQSILGFQKECGVQRFSANLQAVKDACAQAKEISVKVIGLSKKMTESADLGNESHNDGSFNSFIEAVKLV